MCGTRRGHAVYLQSTCKRLKTCWEAYSKGKKTCAVRRMASVVVPDVDVGGLIKRRNKYQEDRNFVEADRIRTHLARRGVFLRDDGQNWVVSKSQYSGKCKRWVHRRKAFCDSPLATASLAAGHTDEDISEYFFCPQCVSSFQLLGRCPCPFDDRHSCLLTKISSHLRLCQSKPGVSFLKANVPKKVTEVVATLASNKHKRLICAHVEHTDISTAMRDIKLLYALSERMASAFDEIFGTSLNTEIFGDVEEDVTQMTDNIQRLFDNLPPIPLEENADITVADIVGKSTSKTKRKHSSQEISISEHLMKLWCVGDAGVDSSTRVAVVEFCSGKGRLSKMILDVARFKREQKAGQATALENKIEFSPIVLIDRTESRHDVLKSPTIACSKGLECIRLNIDISDVTLSSVELMAESKRCCAVGKHLCGVATDLSLKCYCAGLHHRLDNHPHHLGPIGSVTLAMCCHHLCSFDDYVNVGLLQRHGIERGEFLLIKKLVTKYRCHPKETKTIAAKIAGARAQIGVMGKRLLNEGRKVWLKGHSLALDGCGLRCIWEKVRLVRYIGEEVSPENTLLVGLAVVHPRTTAPNHGYKNQQEPTNKSTLSPSGGVVNQYITTG